MNNKDPNRIFSELIGNHIRLWGLITNFQATIKIGITKSYGDLESQFSETIRQLAVDPVFSIVFSELDKEGKTPDILAAETAEISLMNAKLSVNTASIVFGHGVLDSVLYDLCCLSTNADPESWDIFLTKKQVDFLDAKTKPPSELRTNLIQKYLENLEREAIIVKCNRLLAICSPPPNYQPMQSYRYDEEYIKKINKLRQDIVHGVKITQKIDDVDEMLEYMKKTGFYFIVLIKQKHNLMLIPEAFRNAFS